MAVELSDEAISEQLCPDPPKPWSCSEPGGCQSGCLGPGGPSGPGGSSAGGGGPGLGGLGPGAVLRYQAGGIGAVGNPLPADWTTLHGRYWSHDYAERLVPDPDDSHVWLLTRYATFREFFDSDLDGTYETARPSDEYRQLTKTVTGWELRELDGMIHAFDLNGRSLSSTDRNGNAKTATYDANDRLERVDFPDARHELFGYDPNGRLETITEVGVDGTSTRVWTYTWTGPDLTGVVHPDGRSWDLRYDDSRHAGFITRLTLIGDDGTSERVEGAWEYDDLGNVVDTWRGAIDKTDLNAVDRWQFSFDDPTMPVTIAVTDSLGTTSMHTFGRDENTSKPRLEGIIGDCPTACGTGANSSTSYSNMNHPLRATSVTNGRGFVTLMEYDEFGQITSRTEAFGEPEERTTTWDYDPNFPALVTRIERPSTTGDPLDLRVTEMMRDANGNVTDEFHEGVENGSAFSFKTVRTYTTEGRIETIDGPDHGATDLVTLAYDPTRGGLILDDRTDPIIGLTDYGYDAFNRRASTTDVNGVETTTEYDPADRVRFIRQKGEAVDGSEDLVTENRYTTFGDLFQVVLPEGNVIEYAYDTAGRLLTIERKPDDQPTSHGERTRYELNDFGQRVLETQERWESGAWVEKARTAYEYATRCHLDTVTAGSGAEQSVTEYAFDCDTNLERIWDANHPSAGQTAPASTTYTYDALDRLVTVEQPFGDTANTVTTTYTYDVQDHLVEVEDGEGTITSYVYSDRDLMTKETSEVSGVAESTYSDSGQLEKRTDARGIAETWTYDVLDRVTGVDYPDDARDIAYVYDDPGLLFGVGRLASITRAGHVVEYDYDRFGRTVQDGDLSYTYDQNGNRSTISYAGGGMSTYTFDYSDREASLNYDAGAGAGVQSIVTSASYLPLGPLDGLTFANGLEEIRPYDSRYFPVEIKVVDSMMADELHWHYTVDRVGNPIGIVDMLDPANDRTYDYQDYQYFLTRGDGPWGDFEWTYDTIGNRLTEIKDGGFTDLYSYLPNAVTPNPGNLPQLNEITVSGGIRTFQYDAAGNQTQVSAGGNVIDRSYDDAGRMALQERTSAEASSELFYDGRSFLRSAFGREPAAPGAGIFCDGFESGDTSAWDTPGGGSTCLERLQTGPLYDSTGLLHSVDATRVLYFAGRPVAQFAAEPMYLTTDHLGTPIQATNSAMAVSWEGGFEPFGADYSDAQAAGMFLRFPGQWEDEAWEESGVGDEVGYNVMRWYQAESARYSRADPIGLYGDINIMGYARANPLRFIDTLGLAAQVCCKNVPAAAGRVHCYLKIQKGAGEDQRVWSWGLHPPQEDRSFRGGLRALRCASTKVTGYVEANDWFDLSDRYPDVECGPLEEDPCGIIEECIDREALAYPQASGYCVFGPNSNTFAGEVTRKCGLTAPSIARRVKAPGWEDSPPVP